MNAKIKVFRYNPQKDEKPYYKTYSVEIAKGKTVLEYLHEIKWNIDGTLSFRRSCRSAICGSCALRINNKAKLACKTQLIDVLSNDNIVKIDPLDNMNVIKDLVVDKEMFWEKIKQVMPWLIAKKSDNSETSMTEDDIKMFKDSENCIMCGCCYSDCDVVKNDPEFLGPAALVKGYRFVVDPRDVKGKKRIKKYIKGGLWSCAHTFGCIEQCPKNIDPGYRIAETREIAIGSGFKSGAGARNALYYKKSIKKKGKLDEGWYVFNVRGFLGLIGMSNLSIRLFLKKRIPSLFLKKIKGIEEIREIYKEIEAKK